ncbi:MAG: hypothetical protein U0992_09245 [Planctomycetaceae bacterium]
MLQLDRALAIVEHRLDADGVATARAPLPPIERPVPTPAETSSRPTTTPGGLTTTTTANAPPAERHTGAYFAPPATAPTPSRKGFLFISKNQPQRLDPVRISESDEIPLPPR